MKLFALLLTVLLFQIPVGASDCKGMFYPDDDFQLNIIKEHFPLSEKASRTDKVEAVRNAMKLTKEMAKKGDVIAQFQLAVDKLHTIAGIPADRKGAYYLFKKLADQGYPMGKHGLASMYLNGLKGKKRPEDYKRAFNLG